MTKSKVEYELDVEEDRFIHPSLHNANLVGVAKNDAGMALTFDNDLLGRIVLEVPSQCVFLCVGPIMNPREIDDVFLKNGGVDFEWLRARKMSPDSEAIFNLLLAPDSSSIRRPASSVLLFSTFYGSAFALAKWVGDMEVNVYRIVD